MAVVNILGIGGTVKPGSSTEEALRIAVASAEAAGARTSIFGGAALCRLPHYGLQPVEETKEGQELIAAVRQADGLIIAAPGYHGGISGLVKNALDYLEETAKDQRPYLDGVAVGLIATAYGPQAATHTMVGLRSTAHALRGWPTPLGACIQSRPGMFKDGRCEDPVIANQLNLVGRQVYELALLRAESRRTHQSALFDEVQFGFSPAT